MGASRQTELPPVIEVSRSPIFFVNGIAQIDPIGDDCVEFTFFRNQYSLGSDRILQREVVCKLICHIEATKVMVRQTLSRLEGKAPSENGSLVLLM